MSNISARLRKLERGRNGTDSFPHVVIQNPGESCDEAFERHLAEHPGMSEHLEKHQKSPVVILDLEERYEHPHKA